MQHGAGPGTAVFALDPLQTDPHGRTGRYVDPAGWFTFLDVRAFSGGSAGSSMTVPLAVAVALRGMSVTASPTVTVTPEVTVAPPQLDRDGDHERMAHIVLEGVDKEDGEFVSAGTTVAEGVVMGTPVRALCGKVWVPNRDPKRYPLCPTCKEVAQQMGWAVPAS